jgi:acylphosphatase
MKKVCVHLIISGKVQGVSYRLATQRIAEKLELTGCVKNKETGDVDIIATGGSQRSLNLLIGPSEVLNTLM